MVFERSRKTRENLKSLAGIGVADSDREEAEAKGQHDDVQHGILLVALACVTMRVAG
jgi:hypothetical protein